MPQNYIHSFQTYLEYVISIRSTLKYAFFLKVLGTNSETTQNVYTCYVTGHRMTWRLLFLRPGDVETLREKVCRKGALWKKWTPLIFRATLCISTIVNQSANHMQNILCLDYHALHFTHSTTYTMLYYT